ncbi:MAG: 6-phosphofructokinase [bacterium]
MNSQKKKSVAILCSGGPAPGINTVISSVTKSFLSEDYRVLGVNRGFSTLFSESVDFTELDYTTAENIYDKGGSILKMSRYKPADDEFNTSFFKKENVVLLVTIGGDDTASTANRLAKFLVENKVKIKNIHVPKTIDNDLPLPAGIPTFGYETARETGARIAGTVLADARTSDSWFVVSAMGREAGHLAMGMGTANHYPMIIIPEMFENTEPTFKKVVDLMISSIIKRKILGLNYGAIMVSEGMFHLFGEKELENSGVNFTYDEHGHPELGVVSKAHIFNFALQKRLSEIDLKVKSRPVEIGYGIRCVTPNAFDREYCTSLGEAVKSLFDSGKTACIALVEKDSVKPLYLSDLEDSNHKIVPRLVDISSEKFELTKSFFHCIEEKDFDAARKFTDNPESLTIKAILEP